MLDACKAGRNRLSQVIIVIPTHSSAGSYIACSLAALAALVGRREAGCQGRGQLGVFPADLGLGMELCSLA
eukprot:scaffold651010_cov42-Prasinocladus_malaysianus.AAC.1